MLLMLLLGNILNPVRGLAELAEPQKQRSRYSFRVLHSVINIEANFPFHCETIVQNK